MREDRWKWLKHIYGQILSDTPAGEPATDSFLLARTVTKYADLMDDSTR
jgi:hypothetical protein